MTIKLDEQAHERDVDIPLNENFEIILPETRTTGYRWVSESAGDPVCVLLGESTHSSGRVPGQAGTHTWQFRAAQPGTATIEFRYRRPWKQAEAPSRSFKIRVRVAG